jgi:hypothetical protein
MGQKKLKKQTKNIKIIIEAQLDKDGQPVTIKGHHNSKTILGAVQTMAEYMAGSIAADVQRSHPKDQEKGYLLLDEFTKAFCAHLESASMSALHKRYELSGSAPEA